MKKLLAIAIVILGVSSNLFALTPVDATAKASATIIGPITIAKTSDLNFGNLAVNGATAGTAILTATATPTVTTTGGVVVVAGGTTTSAQFTVTGVATYGYTISRPATVTLSDGASHDMVLTLTSLPATSSIPASGSETLIVGGTLAVGATQAAGVYSNTTDLKVTVNYN